MAITFVNVPQVTAATDETEANKALARRSSEEVYNQGKLDVIDEVYAADYTWPIDNPMVLGSAEIKQHVAIVRAAFPDIHIAAEDMIAEGDKVVTRWTIVATHKGEFMGIPPTGKQVTGTGILISRIADGKIAGDWENSDQLGLMMQLGVVAPIPNLVLAREPDGYKWGKSPKVTGDPGDPETNKAIAHRDIEEFGSQGKLEVADEIYSTEFVNHDPGRPHVRNLEGLKQFVVTSLEAFPNSNLTVEDMIAEGDKVALRWKWSGTGQDPDKQLTMTGILIYRFADGKIVEEWWSSDQLGFLQQLGVVPTPGQQE